MTTVLDKCLLSLSLVIVLFIVGAYITDSYLLGAVIALLGCAAILLLTKAIPDKKSQINKTQFQALLQLEGKEYSTPLLQRVFPPAVTSLTEPVVTDAYRTTDNRLIVNGIAYAKVGEEAIAKLYRQCKGTPAPAQIILVCVDIDRKAQMLFSHFDCEVKTVRMPQLYKRLRKQQALPPKPVYKRTRVAWRSLAADFADPSRAKYFALTAAGALLFSVWMPLKIYYYIAAAVNAAIAIGILFAAKYAR